MSKNIIEHVESFLGKIDYGWKADNSEYSISVARFRNQPVKGMCTYVTLGLSKHVLNMPKNRTVKQELIFSTFDTVSSDEIVSFLLNFTNLILSKHEALLRGEVLGSSNSILPGSSMNSVYVSMPIIFDDEFSIFNDSDPSTVFVWLIPIFEDEARYVNENGWEAFEDILEQEDPDLWNLNRPMVSACG